MSMRMESQELVMKKAFEQRLEQVIGDREREASDKVEAELGALRAESAKEQADKVRQMCEDVGQQLSHGYALRQKELKKTLQLQH